MSTIYNIIDETYQGQIYKCNNPIFKDQKVLYLPIEELIQISDKCFDFYENLRNSLGYYVFNYLKTITGEKAFRIAEIDNRYQFIEVMRREENRPIGLLFSQMILMEFDDAEMLLKVSPILDLDKIEDKTARLTRAPIKRMSLGEYDSRKM